MLILNFISTVFLTGLIWFVQIVQYPSFAKVGGDLFGEYHAAHTLRITPLVAPMMLLELVSSAGLVFYPHHGSERVLVWLGLILTLVVWSSTIVFQVPTHRKLAKGFDRNAHVFLVGSNWVRTSAWTAHSLIVAILVWQNLK